MKLRGRISMVAALLAVIALAASPAEAEKKYDSGATDAEIKIGNTMPYSGPASAYGAIGKPISGYFDMLNAEGGVNGRQIKFITLDDRSTPPTPVDQAPRLLQH